MSLMDEKEIKPENQQDNIGLDEKDPHDLAPDETSFIPSGMIEEEDPKDKNPYSFPWTAVIIGAVLVVAIIVCIVVIYLYGGPLKADA